MYLTFYKIFDITGISPLDIAVREGYKTMVKTLIEEHVITLKQAICLMDCNYMLSMRKLRREN